MRGRSSVDQMCSKGLEMVEGRQWSKYDVQSAEVVVGYHHDLHADPDSREIFPRAFQTPAQNLKANLQAMESNFGVRHLLHRKKTLGNLLNVPITLPKKSTTFFSWHTRCFLFSSSTICRVSLNLQQKLIEVKSFRDSGFIMCLNWNFKTIFLRNKNCLVLEFHEKIKYFRGKCSWKRYMQKMCR